MRRRGAHNILQRPQRNACRFLKSSQFQHTIVVRERLSAANLNALRGIRATKRPRFEPQWRQAILIKARSLLAQSIQQRLESDVLDTIEMALKIIANDILLIADVVEVAGWWHNTLLHAICGV